MGEWGDIPRTSSNSTRERLAGGGRVPKWWRLGSIQHSTSRIYCSPTCDILNHRADTRKKSHSRASQHSVIPQIVDAHTMSAWKFLSTNPAPQTKSAPHVVTAAAHGPGAHNVRHSGNEERLHSQQQTLTVGAHQPSEPSCTLFTTCRTVSDYIDRHALRVQHCHEHGHPKIQSAPILQRGRRFHIG